jgi:hypothetical protein
MLRPATVAEALGGARREWKALNWEGEAALHKTPSCTKTRKAAQKVWSGSLPLEKGAEQTGDYPSYASGENPDHWI